MEIAVIGLVRGAQLPRTHRYWFALTVGPMRVHVVEPGSPGSGVYAVDQPDYLILNTRAGRFRSTRGRTKAFARYAVGLHECSVPRIRW